MILHLCYLNISHLNENIHRDTAFYYYFYYFGGTPQCAPGSGNTPGITWVCHMMPGIKEGLATCKANTLYYYSVFQLTSNPNLWIHWEKIFFYFDSKIRVFRILALSETIIEIVWIETAAIISVKSLQKSCSLISRFQWGQAILPYIYPIFSIAPPYFLICTSVSSCALIVLHWYNS